MTVGKLQSKVIKFLDKTFLNPLKKFLKNMEREKVHSFSKAFKISLDKKTQTESEELSDINQRIGKMKGKKFIFVLHGKKYKTVNKEWNDDDLNIELSTYGRDYIFDMVLGYISNLRQINEWTLDKFKILKNEEETDKKYKNDILVKLYFTRYKE